MSDWIETRILLDIALVVFIVAVLLYAALGPSGCRR